MENNQIPIQRKIKSITGPRSQQALVNNYVAGAAKPSAHEQKQAAYPQHISANNPENMTTPVPHKQRQKAHASHAGGRPAISRQNSNLTN